MVTATDSRSATRLFVWVSFFASAVVAAALIVAMNAGVPNTEMSWSVQAPGILEVEGKPTVDVTHAQNGDLVIRIETRQGYQVHRTPLRLGRSVDSTTQLAGRVTAHVAVRTFWRGTRLIVDNGQGRVVSIDPNTALLRPVPASFGWGSGIGQFAGL